MIIYLADLGHNQVTYTSDIYPLGVANLATYAQAHLNGNGENLQFEIFREPQEMRAALDKKSPDVIGFSSYSWNHYLSVDFARYAKAKDPKILTLMGGPNFPLTAYEQEKWLRGMADIDIAVRGPTYEGERAFLNIIKRYIDVGKSLDGIYEEPVPGNMWIDKRTGEFVQGAPVDRILDLDEIPSPYLAGYMDKFFKTGYFAMMQIARGCPFSCQFCNSSVKSNNKIYRHSFENVKADLDYIVEHIKPENPLCFADDNFGMYKEDEEIADYLGFLMDKHNWPKYIRTTTGKNQGERIIRVMRKAKGRLPMTSAVQSLNPVVLENIKRSNISLETYEQIQTEVQNLGMQSYGELILCMPGETKASFMKAVHDLLETGVNRISAHQLMLLHGAPLSNPDSRESFGFKTRFRVVARCMGKYLDEPAIETEEMVVETPDFSFDEYLETRVFHLLLTIYFYEGNFEEIFQFVRQEGIKPYDVFVHMQSLLDQAPAAFRKTIDDYVRENQEELFDTHEECVKWAKENYDGLIDGTIGGNLLSKYSMIGRFYVLHEALDFLELTIKELLIKRDKSNKVDMLNDIMNYFRSVMLHVPFAESLNMSPQWDTSFDIEQWQRDNYKNDLLEYHYSEPQTFNTHVDPETKSLITSRIETFGEHPSGLGRFTRTMFARDLRRKVVNGTTE